MRIATPKRRTSDPHFRIESGAAATCFRRFVVSTSPASTGETSLSCDGLFRDLFR